MAQYIGVPNLPVEESCSKIRLQKCNDLYRKLRNSSLPQATEVLACLVSSWVSGMGSRLTPVRAVSTVVSNVAGEEVGFNVGSHPCLDFTRNVRFRRSSKGFTTFLSKLSFSFPLLWYTDKDKNYMLFLSIRCPVFCAEL
ncbi:unnamed protein product [Orchesella dallaii]|uniref:Uncharacterized protein n=1 Tax=Orchesella dallaii TaxID=48710 RepID=A0ABP1RI63_9HEXA